jgi:NAD(P)-dependent dehydrogenase (short-subunit alcohol dehydrogenase family)
MNGERRLLVLGGTSGIGLAAYNRLMQSGEFIEGAALGYENFHVAYASPMLRTVEDYKPTDIVYSVGINVLDWMRDIKVVEFIELMKTNVWGFINMMQALDRSNGESYNIVAVTSDAAWRPMRTSAVYCASKAALEMAVRVASREYAPFGWRINAVAPGKVADTSMTEYVDQRVLELRDWTVEAAEAYELQSTPLGRKVTKEEVAEVIAQVLFGPAAQTGEIIAVNGGR